MKKNINITIDGPASSGKGTIAKLLCSKIKFKYLDSGALYRGITLYFLTKKIKECQVEEIKKHLKENKIQLSFNEKNQLILNKKNVEKQIRENKISLLCPMFSKNIDIRNFLTKIQQKILNNGNYILDGRDAGSFVCKNAKIKFYLDCDVDDRAKRRLKQLGLSSNEFEKIKNELMKRDEIDKNKGDHSLVLLEDMIYINSTNKSIEEVLDEMYKIYIEKFKQKFHL